MNGCLRMLARGASATLVALVVIMDASGAAEQRQWTQARPAAERSRSSNDAGGLKWSRGESSANRAVEYKVREASTPAPSGRATAAAAESLQRPAAPTVRAVSAAERADAFDDTHVAQAGYEWSPTPNRGEARQPRLRTTRTSDYVASSRARPSNEPELIPIADEEAPRPARMIEQRSHQSAPPVQQRAVARARSQYELPAQRPNGARPGQPTLADPPGATFEEVPYQGEQGPYGREFVGQPIPDDGPMWESGEYVDDGVYTEPGFDCGVDDYPIDGDTGVCGVVAVPQRCPHRMCQPKYWLDETGLFIGVQGFKGPLDLGQNGNFGFHEGLNIAGPIWDHYAIGYQIGATWTQSNLSGSQVVSPDENGRDQIFLTGGLFHRPYHNHGWQFGAAFDWLEDQYYVDSRYRAVRSELSYVTHCGHELGFWGVFDAGNVQEVEINNVDTQFELNSQYLFFYRYNLPNGSNGRIWGGASGKSDGIVGGDLRVYLTNRWELAGGVNYLIPSEGTGVGGASEEGWNISLSLVWYPTRCRKGLHNGQYRSLFPVANNGTMMVDRLD